MWPFGPLPVSGNLGIPSKLRGSRFLGWWLQVPTLLLHAMGGVFSIWLGLGMGHYNHTASLAPTGVGRPDSRMAESQVAPKSQTTAHRQEAGT